VEEQRGGETQTGENARGKVTGTTYKDLKVDSSTWSPTIYPQLFVMWSRALGSHSAALSTCLSRCTLSLWDDVEDVMIHRSSHVTAHMKWLSNVCGETASMIVFASGMVRKQRTAWRPVISGVPMATATYKVRYLAVRVRVRVMVRVRIVVGFLMTAVGL
jgi:hypothetical protein